MTERTLDDLTPSQLHGAKAQVNPTEAQLAARFKPGQTGNPRGMTREAAALVQQNAIMATQIRQRMLRIQALALDEVEAALEVGSKDDRKGGAVPFEGLDAIKYQSTEALRLLADSEARGYGAPVARVELDDMRDPKELTDDELAAIATGTSSGGAAG